MDCLHHYCIQIDFESGKLRFLDGESTNKSDWGKPFSLIDRGDGCLCVEENLAGVKGERSMIDTGSVGFGTLKEKIFERWTNHVIPPGITEVRSPNEVLGGQM